MSYSNISIMLLTLAEEDGEEIIRRKNLEDSTKVTQVKNTL